MHLYWFEDYCRTEKALVLRRFVIKLPLIYSV